MKKAIDALSILFAPTEAQNSPAVSSFAPPASSKNSQTPFADVLGTAQKDNSDDENGSPNDDSKTDAPLAIPSIPWSAIQRLGGGGMEFKGSASLSGSHSFAVTSPLGAERQASTSAENHNDSQDSSKSTQPLEPLSRMASEKEHRDIQTKLEAAGLTNAPIAVPFAQFMKGADAQTISQTNLQALEQWLVEKVQIMKEGESLSVNMTLQPEELGKLTLKIHLHQGAITISMLASPEAKSVLDAGLSELVTSLQKQGIALSGFDVSTDSNGKGSAFSNQNWDGISAVSGAVSSPKKAPVPDPILFFTQKKSEYILGQTFTGAAAPSVNVET